MAKQLNKSKRNAIREKFTSELENDQRKFNEKYEQSLAEFQEKQRAELASAENENNVTIATSNLTDEVSKQNESEVRFMQKITDDELDELNKFGLGAEDVTPKAGAKQVSEADVNMNIDDIPEIEEDARDTMKKQEIEKESGNEKDNSKVITGVYDDDLDKAIMEGVETNIRMASIKAAKLFQENVFLKQFITQKEMGRGIQFSVEKVGKGDDAFKEAEFKLEKIAPGRPKMAIITLPRKLKEALETSISKNSSTYADYIADVELTEEDKQDMVDMVINYNALTPRIALLGEGKIAEFGGVGGELDTGDAVSYRTKTDKLTKEISFEKNEKVKNNTVSIGGKQYKIYEMRRPSQNASVATMRKEALNKATKSSMDRYKKGQTPLKRANGAFSALFTEKNYTSLQMLETVKPFAAGLTNEQAKLLSNKAVGKYGKRDTTIAEKSYNAGMVSGEVLAIFDPSVSAAERFEKLTVAKGYVPVGKDGKPRQFLVDKVDGNGKVVKDTDGKAVKETVTLQASDRLLGSRIPKDFYTGAQLTDMENIEFATYATPVETKSGVRSALRVKKFTAPGVDVAVDETKGIVGTFDINDAHVSRLVSLVGTDLAQEALIKASTQKSSASEVAGRSDDVYEVGQLAAMLATYKPSAN